MPSQWVPPPLAGVRIGFSRKPGDCANGSNSGKTGASTASVTQNNTRNAPIIPIGDSRRSEIEETIRLRRPARRGWAAVPAVGEVVNSLMVPLS